MKALWVGIAVFLFLMVAVTVFSQSGNARISGTIDDPSGAVLPGVSVTATNTATGVVTSTVSNEAGAYNFPSLLPGPYTVAAELPGFQMKVYEVQIGNTQELRLNIRLAVGALVGEPIAPAPPSIPSQSWRPAGSSTPPPPASSSAPGGRTRRSPIRRLLLARPRAWSCSMSTAITPASPRYVSSSTSTDKSRAPSE